MTLASTVFYTALPLLISYYAAKFETADREAFLPDNPADFNLPITETFDFIVVGAGTAGCIVAHRLTEGGKYTVLLLEAGGDPPPIQNVPFSWNLTKNFPEINFVYSTVPQKNSALDNEGVIVVSAGKMMGGSSSHNGMTYERGSPYDYDRWANETGDQSWAYKNILQYFVKAEKYTGNPIQYESVVNKGQHGHEGPISTREDPFMSAGRKLWIEAGKELGYAEVDSNGPHSEGFSSTLFTKQTNGLRESSYTGYIKNIEKRRKNLSVYRYSYVSRIIIENKRAVGVEYTRHGIPRVAFASKEVILSAGGYISPIILIKSGIGPLSEIKKAGVEPVSILPVGENAQDHPVINLAPIFVKKNPQLAWHPQTNLTFRDFDDFVKGGRGAMNTVYQGTAAAFIQSDVSKARDGVTDWPDLQIYYSSVGYEKDSVAIFIGMNRPASRGSIKLNASATSMADDHLPILDLGFFDEEADLDATVQGIRFSLSLIENTTTFGQLGFEYNTEPHKSCTQFEYRSDEYWKCYIRFISRPTWHMAGTCKMGRATGDPTAVVDSKHRVIGVDGLRVVDNSIMPHVTNANTMAAAMLIGEKGSAEILEHYEKKGNCEAESKNKAEL